MTKKNNAKGSVKIQFFAIKERVVKMIDEGYSIKLTWLELKKKKAFSGSYDSFRKHCNTYILLKNATPKKNVGGGINNPSVASESPSIESSNDADDKDSDSIKRASTVKKDSPFSSSDPRDSQKKINSLY